MFWWAMIVFSLFFSIVCFVVYKVLEDRRCFLICLVFVGVLFVLLTFCVPTTINHTIDIENFKNIKKYYETEIEVCGDISIININEANEWLGELQDKHTTYSIFSLIPNEIMQLEEIE